TNRLISWWWTPTSKACACRLAGRCRDSDSSVHDRVGSPERLALLISRSARLSRLRSRGERATFGAARRSAGGAEAAAERPRTLHNGTIRIAVLALNVLLRTDRATRACYRTDGGQVVYGFPDSVVHARSAD